MDDLLGASTLLARLDRWVAEARVDAAAAERARERWLRQIADESATFTGLLLDLAERGLPVVAQGRGRRRNRGTISAVGADFVAMRAAPGTDVLLAFGAIASVRPDDRAGGPTGDRATSFDLGLAEAIAAIAADRPRVLVVTMADGEGVAGELRSVGRDLVALRLDGGAGSAYVPIASIAELRING